MTDSSAKTSHGGESAASPNLGEPLKQAAADLQREARAMAQTIAQAVHETTAQIRQAVEQASAQARQAAEAKAEHTRDAAGECLQTARGRADHVQQGVAARIRENPLAAVAIAAGAGMLLGLIVSRR